MNTKTKKKVILWTLFTIFLMAGFGLTDVKKVNAGYCVIQHATYSELGATYDTFTKEGSSEEDCKSKLSTGDTLVSYAKSEEEAKEKKTENEEALEKSGEGNIGVGQKTEDVCGLSWYQVFSLAAVKCILLYVLKFIGALIQAASTLFVWVIDTDNMKAVMNNSVIYELWGFVRDMLNVAFILVLLFSAFCTVFQISKYSYKNLLLTLIIMALLVNFSFPIARAIIDFSNVIMYYLINGLGSNIKDGKIFIDFAKNGGLADIVNPKVGGSVSIDSDMSFLIAAIVFTFIFMVTLIIIAVLLLIRIVILAVLIIFASIAFVGSIVPFLSKYASEWWDTLFKYAFFGPVMIFMMVVATKMMGEIAKRKGQMKIIATAQSQSSIAETIAAFAFFSIPIVILWVGIGSAQKMSIAGAGAVVGRGQKFMSWVGGGALNAGKWATYKGAWWGAKKTGVPGAAKQRYEQWKKEGWLGSERTAQREAAVAATLGVKGAVEKDMKRRAEEHKKNLTTEAELKALASGGDAAAAFRLAEDKNMDQATYDSFTRNNKTPGLQNSINAKIKQNRADISALNVANNSSSQEYKDTAAANPGWTPNQIKDNVVETAMGKLTAEKLADQDFVSIDQKMPAGPDKTRVINATIGAINGLAGSAKSELAKRLSPANRAVINKFAGSPPGPPII